MHSETTSVVIDTGPDFRYQMLRANVQRLDGILFTHEHKDHTAGLDDVRAFNFKQGMDMPIYCATRVEESLRREFEYAFREIKYPGIPMLEFETIDAETPFVIGDIPFIPIEVMHHRLPVLGFRIGDFTYITDANYISDTEMEKIKGTKILVLNALRDEPHISHYTRAEALEVIQQIQPETAYLTHISHVLGKHADIEAELPPHVHLAYDNLMIQMP